MKFCPAHFVRGHVRISIALHKAMHEKNPSQVLVGLMDMRALEDAGTPRDAGQGMTIDGVPVAVGDLQDGARCVI